MGSPDLDWLPVVGQMQWIVLSRDRRIRSRPAELKLYREHGVRSVWIGGKRDHTSQDLVDIFLAHEERLTRHATKMGPGPWAAAMTATGVRPINVKDSG